MHLQENDEERKREGWIWACMRSRFTWLFVLTFGELFVLTSDEYTSTDRAVIEPSYSQTARRLAR